MVVAGGRRRIGDAEVGPIGLGGARWSLTDCPDELLAVETLCAAWDRGISVIDTAPAYTTPTHPGHNEELIGRVLRRVRPPGVFLVTKAGHAREQGSFHIDGRPQTIHRQCRESLARLGAQQIDLYLLHWPDPTVDLADSVGALADLRDQGLVRMVGVCNVDRNQLETARAVTDIAAVQNRFSLLDQDNRSVVTECAAAGVAHLCYSPLGGPAGAHSTLGGIPEVRRVAESHGATVHQIALAWVLAASPVTIPVVGAGRPDSIRAAADAVGIALSENEFDLLTGAPGRDGR